ncbi:hypothetical protein PsorP6_013737 [Peronosclerospora sorghi]|uniref:Uncharacterized protein n=1 Tax=Peronosclerospora sorghi TaxID=230839 RepID=A0ACC0VHM1_9STRA|nr:hypothetical protein PsorP6_013737 [Peronosclerospora sorghi]
MAKYTGALLMYLIAKRSKKKYGIEEERQALYSALKQLGRCDLCEKRVFLRGQEPNLADLSVFGVLRAMHGLETYNDIMRETRIQPSFTSWQRRWARAPALPPTRRFREANVAFSLDGLNNIPREVNRRLVHFFSIDAMLVTLTAHEIIVVGDEADVVL